jgi:hypothetical protein
LVLNPLVRISVYVLKKDKKMPTALKMFFDDMPDSVAIPKEFQHKQVELILLAEDGKNLAMEWEPDFFEKTYGCITDMSREEQEPLVERESW